MPDSVYLYLYKRDSVRINIDAANEALMASRLGQVYQPFLTEPEFQGPLRTNGGIIELASNIGGWTGYSDRAVVNDFVGEAELSIIAQHIEAGDMIVQLDHVTGPDYWYELSQGVVKKVDDQ